MFLQHSSVSKGRLATQELTVNSRERIRRHAICVPMRQNKRDDMQQRHSSIGGFVQDPGLGLQIGDTIRRTDVPGIEYGLSQYITF